jgi:hypothetical protein
VSKEQVSKEQANLGFLKYQIKKMSE